jgi:uncharacterized protein
VNRFLTSLVRISYENPWRVALLGLVAMVVATGMSSQLGFRGDFTELLPAKTPEVKDLREIEKKAGGTGYLIIQVVGGTLESRREFAGKVSPEIEKNTEVVRFVEHKFDTHFLADRGLLLLTTEKLKELKTDLTARVSYEKKIANPLYVDLEEEAPPIDFEKIQKKYTQGAPASDFIESTDQKELYILVKPASTPSDLDFNRKLIAAVKKSSEGTVSNFPGIKLDYTGAYVARVEEDDVMQSDFGRAALIATVLTLIIILLVSRKFAVLFVVGAPVGLGIAMTFAFTWLLVGHLNPVTGFLGAVLIGLGIEYGLHLAMRYYEERRTHEPREAMQATLDGTFSGAISSAVTNAAAFFVVSFARFDAFKQFGRIAAFGVMATVVTTYLLGPAVLFLSERIGKAATKPTAPPTDIAPFKIPRGILVAVVVVIFACVAASLSVSPKVGFETDLKSLKGESPATELEIHIAKQMGIIMVPAIAWVDSRDTARIASQVATDEQAKLGDKSPIQQVASINDMLPFDTENRLAVIAEIAKEVESLPNSVKADERIKTFTKMTQVKPWSIEELPLEFRRRFEPFDKQGTFVLLFPRFSLHNVDNLNNWANVILTVNQAAEVKGIHMPVLDSNRIAAKIFELVKEDGPLIMLLAAIVVFITIWISLKNFFHTLMVAGPLFAGMACLPGVMLLFDVSLNFFNVVVLPNLLAVAVDNSVHLFHRYKEEGKGSMAHIMAHTGVTAIVATCSNAAGYGALVIAHHAGLRSVGMLAVIGVACTFVGTTILFPALIELREKKEV